MITDSTPKQQRNDESDPIPSFSSDTTSNRQSNGRPKGSVIFRSVSLYICPYPRCYALNPRDIELDILCRGELRRNDHSLHKTVGYDSFCFFCFFCIFSVFWSLFCVHSVLFIMRCLHSLNMHFVTDSQQRNGTETKMQLELVRHRGHRNGGLGHPNNLLYSGDDYYWSQEPAANDWIVFQVSGQTSFIPRCIGIRNCRGDPAIKNIKILGSSDGKEPFDEWLKIKGIEKKAQKYQRFAINQRKGLIAHSKNYHFFKLLITKNYGAKENMFSKFRMYGVDGVCFVSLSVSVSLFPISFLYSLIFR